MKKKEPTAEEPKVDPKIKEAVSSQIENVNKVVLTSLADCLGADLRYYDMSYMVQRMTDMVEKSFSSVDFKDNALMDASKEYFLRKAMEISKSLSVEEQKDPNSREAKCEPICKKAMGDMLDGDFLFNDSKWLDSYIQVRNHIFVIDIVRHYLELFKSRIEFSLGKSLNTAEEKLFGVQKTALTLKMLDAILKSGNKDDTVK